MPAWLALARLHALGPQLLLFLILLVVAADVGAYFAGRRFGRNKLAPRVSPGKSWEGFFGSVVVSTAYGAGFLLYFQPTMPIYVAASLSVVANIAGQLGDLAESAIKRGAGMKDSGTMLPGHGGWLDRVDSSLFTLPVVYFLLKHLQ